MARTVAPRLLLSLRRALARTAATHPALLACFYLPVSCLSLVIVGRRFPHFNIHFDPEHLGNAMLAVAITAVIAPLFAIAKFSFGYVVGFYSYGMVTGYVWLSHFSTLRYEHRPAQISAVLSLLAFLVPALFVTTPIKPTRTMSTRSFDRLLGTAVGLSGVVLAIAAGSGLHFVAPDDTFVLREAIRYPKGFGYIINITTSTILPFAFAYFFLRRFALMAGLALVLSIAFYPVTLTKAALFTPFWLVFLVGLIHFLRVRTAVMLSLMIPMIAGLVLFILFGEAAIIAFGRINLRLIAIPSIALDHYSDFFSSRSPTYYCQVTFLKSLIECPYSQPLSIIMAETYKLGNFNASLFATEGVASVGLVFAPLSAFVCGFVIAIGNKVSGDLPPRFVLLSGSIIAQILMNVPLTTTLLTNGAAILFLLWFVMPRGLSDDKIGV